MIFVTNNMFYQFSEKKIIKTNAKINVLDRPQLSTNDLGSSSNMYIVVPGKGSYIFVHFNSFRTIYTHLRPKENFKSQHKVIDVLNTKRTEQLIS